MVLDIVKLYCNSLKNIEGKILKLLHFLNFYVICEV